MVAVMAGTISVSSTIGRLGRDIERSLRSQLPFATAKALSDTAIDVSKAETKAIEDVFDRPTPFTKRAIGYKRATKATLSARVFVKDVQAEYLGIEITGGTARPKKRALVIPARGLRLNQYGNIPRNKIRTLLARSDTFSGEVRGVPGIWQRTRKGMKLLILYEPKAKYKKRFPFYDIAKRTVKARIGPNFSAAFALALRTAK
jgi:hypothetical protein